MWFPPSSPQEDEMWAPGASKKGREELCPAVRRADLRPLPEAAGKVLELGRRLQRLQPPDLQQVSRGRGSSGLEVHGLPRLQVPYRAKPPALCNIWVSAAQITAQNDCWRLVHSGFYSVWNYNESCFSPLNLDFNLILSGSDQHL